ncbi:MAG: translation initiation factor IF-2 [Candidatus Shapirobacteria bacterium]|nr:translation initiation factor IF-2 [Candidatus Shapirobacteria bacterium]
MKKKITKTGFSETRPPVVVILGHIDHGKTTLLSKIKEIDLTRREHGGITQHIGAYQVKFKNQLITFIDTPGHAAFNQMRSRGAKIADLAVLVVAASEGVKSQTLESLKFIEQADLNFLVALNKIDLPGFNLESAKKNLSDNGIAIEGFGGDIVVVPVSAKEGKGINDLLEMILLLAEMMNLKGNPQAELEASVIESRIDSHKGPLAIILVRNGSLKVGDEIKVENTFGKIRAMFDEKGQSVAQALPSQPVEVLGFKNVPMVGGKVEIVKDKNELVQPQAKQENFSKEEVIKEGEPEKKLKIVLKADMEGTLEAIKNNLSEGCQIIKAEVGEVNDSDVLLADTSLAEVIAFNVKVSPQIKKLAESEKVKMEDVERKVLKIMEPTIDEEILGKAEILAEFPGKEKIAGCRVIEGEIKKSDKIHLLRNSQIINEVRLKSMKQGKEDIQQVKKGGEFGVILTTNIDFKIGDVLVSYRQS